MASNCESVEIDADANFNLFALYRFIPSGSCLNDLDGDGDIDQGDYGVLLAAYGSEGGIDPDPNYNPVADLNGDEKVDQEDLGILMSVPTGDCPG